MSVAMPGQPGLLDPPAPAVAQLSADLNPRTRMLLHAPILPTLLRMAWPNVLVMFAQAATGLIETWFVAKLGTDALAGMALVFPGVMLMGMISAGAMGGGISSAIARALGAGRREEADALVLHALVIVVALGASFSAVMLAFGRPIYRLLGGVGGELEAALSYSNVVFAGIVLLWLMNGLANVIRGTGNMLVPALVICIGAAALVPLSPALIFGLGPIPALGIAGGGTALVSYYAVGAAVLAWYVLSGRNIARLRMARLRWPLFRDILSVGAVASLTSLQTNVTIAVTTALVAISGGAATAAGYGTAARLDSARRWSRWWGPTSGRPTPASVTRRFRRRRDRVCDHRGHRHRRGAVAVVVDHAVQRRSAGHRDRNRLSAPGRSLVRAFRPRPCALLRIARCRPTVVAVVGRVPAHAGRAGRGMARATPVRLAPVAVRRPRLRPGDLRADDPRRRWFGCLVSQRRPVADGNSSCDALVEEPESRLRCSSLPIP